MAWGTNLARESRTLEWASGRALARDSRDSREDRDAATPLAVGDRALHITVKPWDPSVGPDIPLAGRCPEELDTQMIRTSPEERRRLETINRGQIAALQLQRLNILLQAILPRNEFYARKLAGVSLPVQSHAELGRIPFTLKDELVGAGHPMDLAGNHTYPVERYSRYHRTSGTRGRPLVVLDTDEDWQWWIENWQFVLDAAQVRGDDRVFLAFSFGPFIGFWSAHDAAAARGALVIPGGGMNTPARLDLLRLSRATVLCCTPSYALHLAEVASAQGLDLSATDVRRIIVAGEPGGSIPSLRERIESAWDAKVIDHAGATEIGPWGYSDPNHRGLHVLETEFLAEFLAVETNRPAEEGELAELVLTTLGRAGCPVIRYRTGDLVRPIWEHDSPVRFVLLAGGVLGRADDMVTIRGVNIFPSALDQILREFPEITEYRITAHRPGAMDMLTIEIEDRLCQPERVAQEMQLRLGLQMEVRVVPSGSLPRFEGKGRRFVDQRACYVNRTGTRPSGPTT